MVSHPLAVSISPCALMPAIAALQESNIIKVSAVGDCSAMRLKSYQFSQGVASWLLDSERPLRISILVRTLVASVCLILTPDEVGLVWDPHQNVHCRNRSTNDYHQFWLHVW